MKKIFFLILISMFMTCSCGESKSQVGTTPSFEDKQVTSSELVTVDTKTETQESIDIYKEIAGIWRMLPATYFTEDDVANNITMDVYVIEDRLDVYIIMYGSRIPYWSGKIINEDGALNSIIDTEKTKEYLAPEDGLEENIPIDYRDNVLFLKFNDGKTVGFSKITNYREDSANLHPSQPPISTEEIVKNIVINLEKDKENNLAIFITNNNDFYIPNIDIQTLFLKDGNMVGIDNSNRYGVAPHYTIAAKADISNEATSCDVSVDISRWNPIYEGLTDGVTIESNIGTEDNILLKIINNNNVDLYAVSYNILLYKGKELQKILYENYVYNIKANSFVIEEESTYGVDFDNYKIYINEGYKTVY